MKVERYSYACKIDPETERNIMRDRKTIPQFSLNGLINELLANHYSRKNQTK